MNTGFTLVFLHISGTRQNKISSLGPCMWSITSPGLLLPGIQYMVAQAYLDLLVSGVSTY